MNAVVTVPTARIYAQYQHSMGEISEKMNQEKLVTMPESVKNTLKI